MSYCKIKMCDRKNVTDRTDRQTDRQTERRTNGPTDGRTDGWTDGWTDRQTTQQVTQKESLYYLFTLGVLSKDKIVSSPNYVAMVSN